MIPGLMKEKALEVAKMYVSQNPAGSTGYLSDLNRFVSQRKLMIPISFNGTRAPSDWVDHDTLNTGMVMQVKDPKGGRDPQTIVNFRSSDLLLSNNSGKLVVTGSSPNEFTQLDLLYIGQKTDSACAVSMLRMSGAHNSTATSARQVEENAIFNTDVNAPLDPFGGGASIVPNKPVDQQPYRDRLDNIAARGNPDYEKITLPEKTIQANPKVQESLEEKIINKALDLFGFPKLSEFVGSLGSLHPLDPRLDVVVNIKTGALTVERVRDTLTPQGTNARTGTLNYSITGIGPMREDFGYLG